ncbi:MAG: tandem-95 repeat protein, partial [Candidatus Wildermuthbacteria bacterium]|nr:tandem-95 repeat protein [Candidatus Wildermuthbacteria bacterium]
DGNLLSVATPMPATGPSQGTLAFNSNGSFTYTPSANFNGNDFFTYKANDGTEDSNTATVTITVNPMNDAPTLDTLLDASIDEDAGRQTVNLAGITAGGGETQKLTVTAVSNTPALISNPTVNYTSPNAEGSLSYAPAENANGAAIITVTVTDDGGGSVVKTFTVTVNAVNDRPTISDVADKTIDEDTATPALGFTVGDVETAPGNLMLTGDSNNLTLVPLGGIVFGGSGAGRTVTVTPSANQYGTATITLIVGDASGESASNSFVLTVNSENDFPVIVSNTEQTNEDTALRMTLYGSDIETCDLRFEITASPAHGILGAISNEPCSKATLADGYEDSAFVTYTPSLNFSGEDGFMFKVTDADGGFATLTQKIEVNPVNDAPMAAGDSYSTNEDTALTVAAPGVLGNDTDADGNLLSVATPMPATGPSQGTLAFNSNGSFTYTPSANFNGNDFFTYKANDGVLDSNTATVSIIVTAVNDLPAAADDGPYSVFEEDVYELSAPGVLANDTDTENDALSAFIAEDAKHGAAWLGFEGLLSYKANDGWNGEDSFAYRAYDGTEFSNLAYVRFAVTDGTAPKVDDFAVDGVSCAGVAVCASTELSAHDALSITWDAEDKGGSGIARYEVWRSGDMVSWECVAGTASGCASGTDPVSPFSDNPSDGTWWYGMHVVDNADNCITEAAGHCGGVEADKFDAGDPDPVIEKRIVRGPIKVVMAHNQIPNVPAELSPQGGAWLNTSQPALSFNLSDPDAGDQVKYRTQIANFPTFTSTRILVDYTSAPAVQGVSSFVVGQAEGDAIGSYTTGDLGQELSDGNYYWRVKAIDEAGAESSYAAASVADGRAFGIDTGAPAVSLTADPASVTGTWQKASAMAIISCSDSVGGSGCDSASYAFKAHASNPFGCSTNYSEYAASAPDPAVLSVKDHLWVCAAGKDLAGNAGFSAAAVEFKVDKTGPSSVLDAPVDSWLRGSTEDHKYFLRTSEEDLGSGLDTNACYLQVCTYKDDMEQKCTAKTGRLCNISTDTTELFVGFGATHCDLQGLDACQVFIGAKDNVANLGEDFRMYNIDWTPPVLVSKLYTTLDAEDQLYPIRVAENEPVVYKVRAQDNIEIAYCSLYIDDAEVEAWVLPADTLCTTDCLVEFSALELADPAGHIYSNNYAVCYDRAGLGKEGESTDIAVESLGLDLSSLPASGSINTKFDLEATVSGNAEGSANFKFDCGIDDGTEWDFEVGGIDLSASDAGWIPRNGKNTKVTAGAGDPVFAVQDLCQYPSIGSYTAKVSAERSISFAEDTADISISANSRPFAINLSHDNASTDYCFAGAPPVTLSWEFVDEDAGDSQSKYEVQIATDSDFDPIIPGLSGEASSANVQYSPAGLAFNTTYYWRVKVWDDSEDFSDPEWVAGPSFTTRPHKYPVPAFSWTPSFPGAEELIQFTDDTVFAPDSASRTWVWDFGDFSGSNDQNPAHAYAQAGSYNITLKVNDDAMLAGETCSAGNSINNVGLQFPEWQEVSPF